MREKRFSMISCFPPWGKADFRWFLIFPREGKAILIVFWFSLTGDNLFSPIFTRRTPTKASFFRFSFIVPLRKPPFAVFRSSYPYKSFFLPFFVHRTPTKASFCRFSFILPRIWTIFPENWWFTPVSGQIFSKIDDLLSYLNRFYRKLMIYSRIWTDFRENRQFTIVSEQILPKTDDLPLYLNEFPEKAKKKTISLLKTSFEMVFPYWFVSDKIFKKAFVFWHCLRFYFASQSISVVALTRLNVSGVICR